MPSLFISIFENCNLNPIAWVHLLFARKFKMDRFTPEVCQSFQYTPYLFSNYINIEKKV